MANWYNVDTLTSSPSQINFLVFVPLFSLISIAYLEAVPKFMPKCMCLPSGVPDSVVGDLVANLQN